MLLASDSLQLRETDTFSEDRNVTDFISSSVSAIAAEVRLLIKQYFIKQRVGLFRCSCRVDTPVVYTGRDFFFNSPPKEADT